MMHLKFDEKTNHVLFESILVNVVINKNSYTDHTANLLKNPVNASLDESS